MYNTASLWDLIGKVSSYCLNRLQQVWTVPLYYLQIRVANLPSMFQDAPPRRIEPVGRLPCRLTAMSMRPTKHDLQQRLNFAVPCFITESVAAWMCGVPTLR
jgi:hypothetical protein